MAKSKVLSQDAFLEKVRQHLITTGKFDKALPEFLQALAEQFECGWASYWKVDPRVGVLKLAGTWSTAANLTALEEDAKKRTFSSGEGMVGRVWKMRKSLWSNDLPKDMMLPRSLMAHSSGLEKGLWFPIFVESTTFGVIEILGYGTLKPENELFGLLDPLGKEVGEFIEHTD